MNTLTPRITILFDKLKEEETATDSLENQLFGGCYNVILIAFTIGAGTTYALYRYLT